MELTKCFERMVRELQQQIAEAEQAKRDELKDEGKEDKEWMIADASRSEREALRDLRAVIGIYELRRTLNRLFDAVKFE